MMHVARCIDPLTCTINFTDQIFQIRKMRAPKRAKTSASAASPATGANKSPTPLTDARYKKVRPDQHSSDTARSCTLHDQHKSPALSPALS